MPFVDQYGDPVEEKVTGYDFLPERGKLELTAIRLRELTGQTMQELLQLSPAEWTRLLALHKANQWEAPKEYGQQWKKYL